LTLPAVGHCSTPKQQRGETLHNGPSFSLG
jgi:hypothetical protein